MLEYSCVSGFIHNDSPKSNKSNICLANLSFSFMVIKHLNMRGLGLIISDSEIAYAHVAVMKRLYDNG